MRASFDRRAVGAPGAASRRLAYTIVSIAVSAWTAAASDQWQDMVRSQKGMAVLDLGSEYSTLEISPLAPFVNVSALSRSDGETEQTLVRFFDSVPEIDSTYRPSSRSISEIYRGILNNAVLCADNLSKPEKAHLGLLQRKLFVVDKNGDVKKPVRPSKYVETMQALSNRIYRLFKRIEELRLEDDKPYLARHLIALKELNFVLDNQKGKEKLAQFEMLLTDYRKHGFWSGEDKTVSLVQKYYRNHVTFSLTNIVATEPKNWDSRNNWKRFEWLSSEDNTTYYGEMSIVRFERPWMDIKSIMSPCYVWRSEYNIFQTSKMISSGTGNGNGELERLPVALFLIRNISTSFGIISDETHIAGLIWSPLPKQPSSETLRN